jgi:hypothetical protein
VATRHYLSYSLNGVVQVLNPVLRGWAEHFRRGNANGQFAAIDRYVTFRLARFDQDKRQRNSLGRTMPELLRRLHDAVVYPLRGDRPLFAGRACDRMKHVGEPGGRTARPVGWGRLVVVRLRQSPTLPITIRPLKVPNRGEACLT